MPATKAELSLEAKQTKKYSIDTLLMLSPLITMSWYYYGERALRLVALSVLVAVLTEAVGGFIIRKKSTIADFDAFTIGVIIPLLLPASSPIWFVLVGTFFAIAIVKLPFGNARSVPFDPTSAAIAFLTLCSGAYTFGYPVVAKITGDMIIGEAGFLRGTSIAAMLFESNSIGTNLISFLDLWVGNYVGPMGATCGFALLGVFFGMLLRRRKALVTSVSFFVAVIVFAIIFPRVLTGVVASATMEISSGMLIFAALFLVTNPAILPKETMPRVAYGFSAGAVCMLVRYFGVFEEGVCFAILFVNAISPVFDKIKTPSFLIKKKSNSDKKENEEALAGEATLTGGGLSD